MSTRLILIRHGETDWSLKKRYCGSSDPELNNNGILQAKRLYDRLRDERIDRFYSSDAKRALNFARIAFRGAPIEKMPELKEMDFGIFEGLTHEEIAERHRDVYANWLSKPLGNLIPKGESLAGFKKRVEKTFRRLVSLNKNAVLAIVTHGGPIKIIISDVSGNKNLREVKVDPASINIVDFKNGTGKIMLFNDTSHLYG